MKAFALQDKDNNFLCFTGHKKEHMSKTNIMRIKTYSTRIHAENRLDDLRHFKSIGLDAPKGKLPDLKVVQIEVSVKVLNNLDKIVEEKEISENSVVSY